MGKYEEKRRDGQGFQGLAWLLRGISFELFPREIPRSSLASRTNTPSFPTLLLRFIFSLKFVCIVIAEHNLLPYLKMHVKSHRHLKILRNNWSTTIYINWSGQHFETCIHPKLSASQAPSIGNIVKVLHLLKFIADMGEFLLLPLDGSVSGTNLCIYRSFNASS